MDSIIKCRKAKLLCTEIMNDVKTDIVYLEASCFYILKNYDECIKLLDIVLKIDPNNELAKNQQSLAFNVLGFG